jgi:hypothetical protein
LQLLQLRYMASSGLLGRAYRDLEIGLTEVLRRLDRCRLLRKVQTGSADGRIHATWCVLARGFQSDDAVVDMYSSDLRY